MAEIDPQLVEAAYGVEAVSQVRAFDPSTKKVEPKEEKLWWEALQRYLNTHEGVCVFVCVRGWVSKGGKGGVFSVGGAFGEGIGARWYACMHVCVCLCVCVCACRGGVVIEGSPWGAVFFTYIRGWVCACVHACVRVCMFVCVCYCSALCCHLHP